MPGLTDSDSILIVVVVNHVILYDNLTKFDVIFYLGIFMTFFLRE